LAGAPARCTSEKKSFLTRAGAAAAALGPTARRRAKSAAEVSVSFAIDHLRRSRK